MRVGFATVEITKLTFNQVNFLSEIVKPNRKLIYPKRHSSLIDIKNLKHNNINNDINNNILSVCKLEIKILLYSTHISIVPKEIKKEIKKENNIIINNDNNNNNNNNNLLNYGESKEDIYDYINDFNDDIINEEHIYYNYEDEYEEDEEEEEEEDYNNNQENENLIQIQNEVDRKFQSDLKKEKLHAGIVIILIVSIIVIYNFF